MPFDLVNVGQTYQRMINNLFKNMFGQNMKVYVDDMMVEYVQGQLHVTDLRESFKCMHMHNIRLTFQMHIMVKLRKS